MLMFIASRYHVCVCVCADDDFDSLHSPSSDHFELCAERRRCDARAHTTHHNPRPESLHLHSRDHSHVCVFVYIFYCIYVYVHIRICYVLRKCCSDDVGTVAVVVKVDTSGRSELFLAADVFMFSL